MHRAYFGANTGGVFRHVYRCHSSLELASMTDDRANVVEQGGKIILPPSALEELARYNIVYPMLFKLENKDSGRETHCGVLEFIADEGRIYLPTWMMRNLSIESGKLLTVSSATCPVASFSKFQPQSVNFLDISNPKAVLENTLRKFACLTKGDMIGINYNDTNYELLVMEVKPANAVSIIETDMEVDFAPAVGYVEPERVPTKAKAGTVIHGPRIGGEANSKEESEEAFVFKPFRAGVNDNGGVRVDNKQLSKRQLEKADERKRELEEANAAKGPDAGHVLDRSKAGGGRGRLFFAEAQEETDDDDASGGHAFFGGSGNRVKDGKVSSKPASNAASSSSNKNIKGSKANGSSLGSNSATSATSGNRLGGGTGGGRGIRPNMRAQMNAKSSGATSTTSSSSTSSSGSKGGSYWDNLGGSGNKLT